MKSAQTPTGVAIQLAKEPRAAPVTFQPYWIIWNPESTHPPKATYKSEEQARHVANTMAARHPGQLFVVLSAIAGYMAAQIAVAEVAQPRGSDTTVRIPKRTPR